jgi:hypothetical protein
MIYMKLLRTHNKNNKTEVEKEITVLMEYYVYYQPQKMKKLNIS